MTEEVKEKSVLEQMIEEQEKRNKEAQEAKERKASGGSNYVYEDVKYFPLEDKKERVCRIMGLPAELRKNPTDAKFVLRSEVLKDTKKDYLNVNWPIVERDGKMIPDPDWFLTRFLNKVREGKWVTYEDGKKNEKTGKNGEWKKFHTETSVFKRVDGNSKPNEKFPKNFYPSIKVYLNVVDRHDNWCKENKHTKMLVASDSPYTFTDDEGKEKTIYYPKPIPKQCYLAITEHFKNCIGIKSLSDWDAVIIKDGKSETVKYQCFDKTDYPKYLKSKEAADLASNEPLTEEEKAYILYDIDSKTRITSYASLKRHLNGLFKLCDAELGTSFEKELEMLCKEEAANRPTNNSNESSEEKQEERFASLDDEKPMTEKPVEEKARRERKAEPTSEISIVDLCIKNFPMWNKLKEKEKQDMINGIASFNGGIPVYKTKDDVLCYNQKCTFKDSNEPTSFLLTVYTCPVCGETES